MTVRPSIVAATMSKGADLCQSFTLFGLFKCALLKEDEAPVWARATDDDVT
jgi:hypothetical protein